MNTSGIERVAEAIVAARREHRQNDANALPDALQSAADAYAVQDAVAREMGWPQQGVPRYWKSGGPSRDLPLTHAALPPEGVWASPADARQWPFHQRLIEAEVALRVGRDAQSIEAMTVSIEVVDFRWEQGAQAPALFKLADLQSHGALVLGEWKPYTARDWSNQKCTVQIGTQPVREFRGTHALVDPAWLLPIWVQHATRNGGTVEAGTVITTGTWCGMLTAAAGDLVTVRFEGIGEASVQL
jgi:2-keto-4-pentenoate hydratase